MAELIQKQDTLNEGRVKINAAITDAEQAKVTAGDADSKATQALANSESTQTQLDTIVINGDSSVEAAQARVDEKGVGHTTLKDRIDDGFTKVTSQLNETNSQLAQKTTHLNSESIKLTETTEQIKPVAFFIFDDGYKLDLTHVKPLFDSKGIVATSVIITDRVGTGFYMTVEEIKQLRDAGWEIGSHSKSHVQLSSLSEEELIEELKGSRDQLIEWGFDCKTMVMPFGNSSGLVRSLSRKYYKQSFTRASAVPNNIPVNMHDLGRLNIGDDSNQPFDHYKNYIDRCIRENAMIAISSHSNQLSPAQFDILEQVIDYLQSLDIEITTPSKALEMYGNAFEMWNEYSGEHTVITNRGDIHGSDVNYITKLETDSVTPDTPYTDFPRNKISFCKISSFHGNLHGFPRNSAGILVTDNRYYETGYPHQTYYLYGRDEKYSRTVRSNGSFEGFLLESSMMIFGDVKHVDESPSSYALGKITITHINSTAATANGYPGAGTLKTDRTGASDYVYQEFHPIRSSNVLKRFWHTGTNSWSVFESVSHPNKTYETKNVMARTINANSSHTVTWDSTYAAKGLAVVVTPTYDLADGLVFSSFIPENGKVKLRIANYTTNSVSLNSGDWVIKVLRN